MNLRTKLLCGLAACTTSILVAQAQVPGVNSTLNSVFTLAYDNSTMKQTFSATSQFTPSTSTNQDVCILTGSATKTVKVRRVIFSGIATAVFADPIAVIKRSTLSTNTAATTMVETPYDSRNSAGTVVADFFTGTSTLGATVGTLADIYGSWGNATTGLGSPTIFTFGALGQPAVLHGTTEMIALNLGGIGVAGGAMNCTFEWTEE